MRLFLTLSFLLFFSCNFEDRSNYRPSEKEKITDRLLKKASIEIQKNTGLIPAGSGAQMMHEIKMLGLSFDFHNNLNINESRKLLICAIDEFSNCINSDKGILPYLATHPFSPKNIELRIFFINPDRTIPSQGKLIVASAINGLLKYKIYNEEEQLTVVYSETYEEAKEKLLL